jgi:hypothetical protein
VTLQASGRSSGSSWAGVKIQRCKIRLTVAKSCGWRIAFIVYNQFWATLASHIHTEVFYFLTKSWHIVQEIPVFLQRETVHISLEQPVPFKLYQHIIVIYYSIILWT